MRAELVVGTEVAEAETDAVDVGLGVGRTDGVTLGVALGLMRGFGPVLPPVVPDPPLPGSPVAGGYCKSGTISLMPARSYWPLKSPAVHKSQLKSTSAASLRPNCGQRDKSNAIL